MAPSANRHSGYSRKAQYSTFFGYAAGVLGALIGFGLLIFSIAEPSAFAGARGVAADATAPGAEASAEGRAATRGVWGTIVGYLYAGSRYSALEREMEVAKVRLVEARAVEEENRRLKALLGLVGADPRPVAVTQLTSSTVTSTRRFATIAAGSDQGVGVGMPVRSPLGLVGRVLEPGRTTSRVLLVTDTESVVPVRRAGDGIPAFAHGNGDGTLQIRLINLGINPLKPGDVLVTSGSGGLYRPNTAVAAVVRLTRDGAVARILSDPATSEYVIVDRTWEAQVLQPAPAPRPSGATPP